MRSKHLILLGTLAAFLILCGGSATAQIVYGQPASGNVTAYITHWKVTADDGTETTLNQFAIPLTGFVPVREDFEVSLYIANASNSVDFPDAEYKLSGLSDVRLQANHSFVEDQLLLSVGVNLPTGKKKLSLGEEWAVLRALSQNYLDFPVVRLGEGLGFNALLGGAAMLSEKIRGGAGIMYQYVGKYEPYEGYADYDPGDLISANAGADFEGKRSTLSIDAILTMYTDDKKDSEKIFRQSTQLDLRLSARVGDEKKSFAGMARYVMRGDNKQYDESGAEISSLKMFGDEFSIMGGATFMFANEMYFSPAAELRSIAGNGENLEAEIEGATIIGFGGTLGKRIGENLNLEGGFKYYTGSAHGGDLDLSGYQITFGLAATM